MVMGEPLLSERGGRLPAVSAVGSVHVVVDSVVLEQDLGLKERVEKLVVEDLVAQSSVARLDDRVLPGVRVQANVSHRGRVNVSVSHQPKSPG